MVHQDFTQHPQFQKFMSGVLRWQTLVATAVFSLKWALSSLVNNYRKSIEKLRENTLVQGNYPADCDVNEIGGYLTECTVSPPSSLNNVEQSSGQALLARFICLPGMFLARGFADKTGKQKQEVSPTCCLRS